MAQEIVNELLSILKGIKYNEVRANVALKNWPALRFWTKLGLNTINGNYGEKEHGTEKFADIVLSKHL
jgi:diamine N-acetyltransferase